MQPYIKKVHIKSSNVHENYREEDYVQFTAKN